jgi:hypothetical protein
MSFTTGEFITVSGMWQMAPDCLWLFRQARLQTHGSAPTRGSTSTGRRKGNTNAVCCVLWYGTADVDEFTMQYMPCLQNLIKCHDSEGETRLLVEESRVHRHVDDVGTYLKVTKIWDKNLALPGKVPCKSGGRHTPAS